MKNVKRLHAERIGDEITLANALPEGHFSARFFCCPQRRAALKELWFGLSNGEAGVLTAPGRVGKTLVCRELLQRLPFAVRSIYLLAPDLHNEPRSENSGRQFLATVAGTCERMRQIDPGQAADNNLTAGAMRGTSPVWTIIIDEAHRLSAATIERLADWRERQIGQGVSLGLLLVGRPALDATLAQPELRQFNSQITVRCSLAAFPQDSTESYISHWVKTHPVPRVKFSDAANRIVHYATGGNPALINQVCVRALASVRAHGYPSVTALIAARAAWTVSGS